jgi:rhamnose transport system permease protein
VTASVLPRRRTIGDAAVALTQSRELVLIAIIVALCIVVASQSPAFLSARNLQNVTKDVAIIAIAAVGQAVVVMTRNIDLSVEATIGLVAYVVGDLMRGQTQVPQAWALGLLLGVGLGLVNGILVTGFKVPSIVATLATLSLYRGLAYYVAKGREVNLRDLPPGYTSAATQNLFGVPLFAIVALILIVIVGLALRYTLFGRRVYAVGSNAVAAAILGIRSRLVVLAAFALCGFLAGVAGILWGVNYGTIYASSASGTVLAIVAAVVVGGVSISGGTGTVIGAALGALFLGLVNNALLVLLLPQEWLQVFYGAVILLAVAADAIVQRRARITRAAGALP